MKAPSSHKNASALVVGLLLILMAISGALFALRESSYVLYLLAASVCLVTLYSPRAGLYLMIFMAPLQYLVVLDSGITLVRLLGIVVFASWALRLPARKVATGAVLDHSLVLPMLAFLGACGLSVLWSDFDVWQTSMMTFLQLAAWMIVIVDLIDTKERLATSLLLLLLANLLSAGLSVQEFHTQVPGWQFGQRGLGGFGDPNYTSASLMVSAPFALYLIDRRRGWSRLFGVGSVSILLAGVAFAVSRAGILAILVLLVRELMFRRQDSRLQSLFVFVLVALISAPLWPWANLSYRFSIAWTGGNLTDLGDRWGLLNEAWASIVRSPLTGSGLGYSQLGGRLVVHNLFAGLAVQIGVLGLLTMIWLWAAAWANLMTASERLAHDGLSDLSALVFSVQSSVVIYFFFSLTLSNESSRLLWLVFALSAVCFRLALAHESPATLAGLPITRQPSIGLIPSENPAHSERYG
jgi:hypothetical protein